MTGARKQRAVVSLRDRAENALLKTRRDVASLPTDDVQHLVHELQVHQVELEMQNEELRVRTHELEETRSQYQALYEFAPTGYLDLDSSGVIRQANLAAGTLLDLERQRLVGSPLSEFVDVKDELVLHEHLRETARSVRSVCEVRLSMPEGNPRHVLLVTSCDTSPGAGYLMALMDVTESRRAQDALCELNQDLEQRVLVRTAELAQQNRRLEAEIAARAKGETERHRLEGRLRDAERLESLGLLAGGIAHDFNNLLVGVLGTADLLLHDKALPAATREAVGVIKRAARSASDLTGQMLAYAGRSQAKLAPVDLHRAIADTVHLLRGRLPRFTEIRMDLGDDLPPIDADRGQVQQVLTNLILNAVEALPEETGTVVIRTRAKDLDAAALGRYLGGTSAEPGRFVALEVSDTGRGMDAATLTRVFDAFYTTKSTGRGLGLASVLGIMQGHSGAVRARSEPGRGATFEVVWRVSVATVPARTSSIPAAEWRGSGRVLVVDDDPLVLDAVSRQLAFLGFEIIRAESGEEGLRLARESSPPVVLVVLDRTMPGLSGDEVLARLKEEAPALPVVLMSGWSADGVVLPGDKVTSLQKPMTLSELRAAVRRVLEAGP